MSFLMSLPTLLHSAVIFGTVILFGAMGEILTEKGGNLNLGNDKEFLIRVISCNVPFIGYPRTLNALACIREVCG